METQEISQAARLSKATSLKLTRLLKRKQRQNINTEFTIESIERLQQIISVNGMTQKEVVGRVISWFSQENKVTQQVILGLIPEEIAPDIAALMLRRMADQRNRDRNDHTKPDANHLQAG